MFQLVYNNEFLSLKMLNAGRKFFPVMAPIADKLAVNVLEHFASSLV